MKQILKYLLFLIIGIIFYILLNNIDHFNIGVPPRDTLQYYCITEGFPFYLGSTNEEIRIVRGTDGAAGAAGQPEHTGGAAGPSTVQVDNPLYDAGAGE